MGGGDGSAGDEAAFWDAAWARFVACGTTSLALSAWDDEEWPTDRRYLTVLAEVPSLEALAVRVASSAGCPPVRADGLHLTIQELGFADELSPDLISRILHADLRGQLDLTVNGVCSFRDAIVATVTPFEPVRQLRRTLRKAAPELANTSGDPDLPAVDGGTAPHITLSYYDRELSTRDIAGRLPRTFEPQQLRIESLSLVAVHPPDGDYFTWDTIARIPLTGSG